MRLARAGERAVAQRSILYYLRAATCWQPEIKELTMMTNSQYNGWRFEDVWLDK